MKLSRFALMCIAVLPLWLLSCSDSESTPIDTSLGDADEEAEVWSPDHDRIAYWYEDANLVPLTEKIELLGQYRVEINLAIHRDNYDLEAFKEFALTAHEHDVTVNVWPMLDPSDGYFPNVRNVELFRLWWDELVSFVQDNKLPIDTFIADMEPNLDALQEMQNLFSDDEDPMDAIVFLADRYDEDVYTTGKTAFISLVEDTRARGFRVVASTLFQVLDDFQDGDDTIQKVFDVPIKGVGWDEVSFQLYRSSINDFLGNVLLGPGESFGPYLTYEYAVTAHEEFGDRAALDLGIVGFDDYSRPADLFSDIGAAQAAGFSIDKINVYSLQGLIDSASPGEWFDFKQVDDQIPTNESEVALLRSLLQGVDLSYEH